MEGSTVPVGYDMYWDTNIMAYMVSWYVTGDIFLRDSFLVCLWIYVSHHDAVHHIHQSQKQQQHHESTGSFIYDTVMDSTRATDTILCPSIHHYHGWGIPDCIDTSSATSATRESTITTTTIDIVDADLHCDLLLEYHDHLVSWCIVHHSTIPFVDGRDYHHRQFNSNDNSN